MYWRTFVFLWSSKSMNFIARIHCASMQQFVSSGPHHMPSSACLIFTQSIAARKVSRIVLGFDTSCLLSCMIKKSVRLLLHRFSANCQQMFPRAKSRFAPHFPFGKIGGEQKRERPKSRSRAKKNPPDFVGRIVFKKVCATWRTPPPFRLCSKSTLRLRL